MLTEDEIVEKWKELIFKQNNDDDYDALPEWFDFLNKNNIDTISCSNDWDLIESLIQLINSGKKVKVITNPDDTDSYLVIPMEMV